MKLRDLLLLKESEDKVEFKEARGGNYSFNGGNKVEPKERRKCIVGYVTAFANEGGGFLVFGIHDKYPHYVTGTNQAIDSIGKLEQDIYRETKIRVNTFELYEEDSNKRVLVIQIPNRPAGKVYKFEDVALMRVGEELLPMSDEYYLKIIQEQEPDFSEKICKNLSIEDLDEEAVLRMKEAYSRKQGNPLFPFLANEQALSDLNLIKNGKLTYAALILLGKEQLIKKYLPQSAINLEYRGDDGQIVFNDRHIFTKPYFLSINDLWNTINLRNGKFPVQEGPFIFDIPFFNQEVIREAINNAVAHRDYRRTSEVVVKQYPRGLQIISPGGFPIGVNLDNLLTISSTPRNRLLADVLAKTGVVERSGQGVDKIFYQSISEGKGVPDYSFSDDFQVQLNLSAIVKDKAFALFINQLQENRDTKLSVLEVITLNAIKEGIHKSQLNKDVLEKLFAEGLIEKVGKTHQQIWCLSKLYYSFTGSEADYTRISPIDDDYILMRITQHLKVFESAKMGDFVNLFQGQLTRDQVKKIVYKLSSPNSQYLESSGNSKNTTYILGKATVEGNTIIKRAIEVGLEELKKRGELNLSDSDKDTEKTQKKDKNI